MTGRDVWLDFYGMVRVRFDAGNSRPARRFLTALYYRYVSGAAPQPGRADIVVACGPIPAEPARSGDIEWRWSHKRIARYRARIRGLARSGGGSNAPVDVWVDGNRFGLAFFIGRVLDVLIKEAFLRQNVVAAHAAGVTGEGRGVLLPARQGTGKTLMALVLMRQGYRLLGDDRVLITPDGQLLGMQFPLTVRTGFGTEQLLDLTAGQRLNLAVKKWIGRLTFGYYQLMTCFPVEDILSGGLAERAPLTDIVLLAHGPAFADRGTLPLRDAIGLLVENERHANPDANALIGRVAAADPTAPLGRYWTRYRQLLEQGLGGARLRQVTVPKRFSLAEFEKLAALLDTVSP